MTDHPHRRTIPDHLSPPGRFGYATGLAALDDHPVPEYPTERERTEWRTGLETALAEPSAPDTDTADDQVCPECGCALILVGGGGTMTHWIPAATR